MKKHILLPALATLIVSISHAQPLSSVGDDRSADMATTTKSPARVRAHHAAEKDQQTVGVQTRDAFLSDFREAKNERWTPGAAMDRVDFTFNGSPMTAYYDQRSTLIGTTAVRTVDDLPARAKKEISKAYPGWKIDQVIYFKDNNYNETDMTLYDIRFNDEDNYFVKLTSGTHESILQVSPEGEVSLFKKVR